MSSALHCPSQGIVPACSTWRIAGALSRTSCHDQRSNRPSIELRSLSRKSGLMSVAKDGSVMRGAYHSLLAGARVGCCLDETGDFGGMRDHCEVTCRNLDDRCTHALSEQALAVGRECLILSRDEVPRRPPPPSGHAHQ